MINLFLRNQASIDDIGIPDFGWELTREEKNIRQWINPEQTIALSLNFFKVKPDIPTLDDWNALRRYYRNQIVPQKGGLIEVEPITLGGYSLIKAIFKFPQAESGTTYLSSLTIPFAKYSYVVKIQAMEGGFTGMLESFMLDKLIGEGKVTIDDAGNPKDWASDPYLKGFLGGTLMNLSESEEYDNRFRTHPLSLSRKMLRQIEDEIVFSSNLQKIKPFTWSGV